jgi:hypothetical protein
MTTLLCLFGLFLLVLLYNRSNQKLGDSWDKIQADLNFGKFHTYLCIVVFQLKTNDSRFSGHITPTKEHLSTHVLTIRENGQVTLKVYFRSDGGKTYPVVDGYDLLEDCYGFQPIVPENAILEPKLTELVSLFEHRLWD